MYLYINAEYANTGVLRVLATRIPLGAIGVRE